MNGATLAPGLAFAAIGLALSFGRSRRVIASGCLVLLASALVAAAVGAGPDFADVAVLGCWISVMAAVACMYLPHPLGYRIAVPICVNAGIWAGLTTAASGRAFDVALALSWALLCWPGLWLVARGQGIVVKVAGSWLAAAAILSLGLNMTPTLGYEPDHME